MPARRFFAMVNAGRRIMMAEYAELCDIAAIPMCDPKYHRQLKGAYVAGAQKERPKAPPPSGYVIDSASPEAKNVFMSIFAGRPN